MKRRTLLATAALAGVGAALPQASQAATPARLNLPASYTAMFLGDSYSVSTGASPKIEGWAYKSIPMLGCRGSVDAVGGTGYINPGSGGTYNDRLWRQPADAFDLIVLQGGSNDYRVNADGTLRWSNSQITGAVNQTIRTVLRRFPKARLVLMGPTHPSGSYGQDRLVINAILKRYAASYSLPFVDPIGETWFRSGDWKAYADPASGHPNNAGYLLMANRFVADIKTL